MQVSSTGFSTAADEGHVREEIHKRELAANPVGMPIIGVLTGGRESTPVVGAVG